MEIKFPSDSTGVCTWTEFVSEMFEDCWWKFLKVSRSGLFLCALTFDLAHSLPPHHHGFCLVSTSGAEFRVLVVFCLALVISQLRNRTTEENPPGPTVSRCWLQWLMLFGLVRTTSFGLWLIIWLIERVGHDVYLLVLWPDLWSSLHVFWNSLGLNGV